MDVALLCVTKFNIGIEECIKVQSTNPVLQRGQGQNVKVEAGWPRISAWAFLVICCAVQEFGVGDSYSTQSNCCSVLQIHHLNSR